jgi:hypothetical protein
MSVVILVKLGKAEETNLVLRHGDGLREAEEGKSEVDKAVLVLLDILLAVDDLQPVTIRR